MSRLKLKGNRAQLARPEIQFQIWQQLSLQKGLRRRFSVQGAQGEVILDPRDTPSQVVNLIKAKAKKSAPEYRGEVDVIKELASEMSALHKARVSSLMDEIEDIFESDLEKGFRPPASVARAAERGLELRREHGRGGLSAKQASEQGIGSGVQRAVNLKNRDELSLETVKRMKNFFNRHRTYKERGYHRDRTSASYISWLLWGGDAGDKWAQKVVKQESEK
jgi:hypothetical protein